MEVVAKNLRIHHGMPLVCDDTLVSPLTADGRPVGRAAKSDGAAIELAESRKFKKYPELVRSHRCHFIVLAHETGGRWSHTCCELIRALAVERSSTVAPRLRDSTARAWEHRWWAMLSVATQNALAATMLDDAPHMLHAWEGSGPPLGMLLHGEAPTISRLPLR